MKYEIDILNDKNDNFEKKADNVAIIKILDPNGKIVSNEYKIQLYLNENALLGLGTELIRLAHHYKNMKHIHIEPSTKEIQVQKMGIFLTPDSSELTIICSENGVIDKYFE